MAAAEDIYARSEDAYQPSVSLVLYRDDIKDCPLFDLDEETQMFTELRSTEQTLDDLILRTRLGKRLVSDRARSIMEKRFRDYNLFLLSGDTYTEEDEDAIPNCRFGPLLKRMVYNLTHPGIKGIDVLEGRKLEPVFRQEVLAWLRASPDSDHSMIFAMEDRRADLVDEATRHNYPLVIALARRYYNKGLPEEDVNQTGNIALLKAIDRYDPGKGARFAPYAAKWITNDILRGVFSEGRTIPVSGRMAHRICRVMYAEGRMFTRDGVEHPTDSQLADELGWDEDMVRKVRAQSRGSDVMSLNRKIHEHDDCSAEFQDRLADRLSCAEETVSTHKRKAAIRAVVDSITEVRDRQLLKLHFGLDSPDVMPVREISKVLGKSKSRIDQIEKALFANLRFNPALMQLAEDEGFANVPWVVPTR